MKIINNKYELQVLLNNSNNEVKNKYFDKQNAKLVRNFHSKFNEYMPTPLVSLEGLAKEMNVSKILVKDESKRFGLNAFKVLGGSYAIAKLICKELKIDIDDIDFEYLKSTKVREKLGDITFVTATDGNHGRGIAWAAKELNQKAVVYMPRGSATKRINAIEKLGAKVIVTNLNYDDAVRLALEESEKHGWYMVQDTAWNGYEEIPRWIMQGYMTMANETVEQMKDMDVERPSHVILQAGVGAMAGAVLGYLSNIYEHVPKTIIVEPTEAACLYKTAEANDGKIHKVEGDLLTIMAGLACGEPNPLGWSVLKEHASAFATCGNYVSANGMRILSAPVGNDERIVSGESGAVGIGLLNLLSTDELSNVRKALGIDKNSIILLFSTEGDTDSENYRRTVWEGKNSLIS
ncbi:MAG: diaminopropionate ammonia-lyase [Clostridiales bacterium]|nr:diaminopropionate ammonia-lyase [Clostridiales bacterium]